MTHRLLKSHRKTIFEILGRGPIHPFPARMAPGIALDALSNNTAPLRVLDPMAGSGTVLAVARANGHRAVGVDLDPLAVLLAGVWTRTIDPAALRDKAHEVLDRARFSFRTLSCAKAYPAKADEKTKAFIRYWFDPYARRQLSSLSAAVGRVHDDCVRDALWCGFSRLIITKSSGASLAMDLSHSRPHKSFKRAPVKPFKRFIAAVDVVASNCPHSTDAKLGPVAVVRRGDARRLGIDDKSIDVVLTSPPYLNAIDYMRCSKFSLVWMGYLLDELSEIRSASVGAEAASPEATNTSWVKALVKQLGLKPTLSNRHSAVLERYVKDMDGALSEVSRVLKSGGKAVYVVGDSTTRGTFISNSRIVKEVAERNGMTLSSEHVRALPASRRYLPPPTSTTAPALLDARMRREAVLVFCKA